ncbi:endosome/lysosome-associated apoptosis and autophagy regulator family member 2-like [Gordionus sp. m RMFG-2023]|uniref:endosome/lysosome-associated apoptosis and autophagy regulator family member 2-like n=1 Tax=Gordionus sp. m RMFG-2023 TaxID=3053472 RepID=UPI0031FD4822
MKYLNYYFVIYIIIAIYYTIEEELPRCQKEDFHYEFTECDKHGGRWRVSVPDLNKCIGGEPMPPQRGKDCMFSCSPGYFLDIQGDQECHPCLSGTYSLGGGLRFEEWNSLPPGFKSLSEGVEDRDLGDKDASDFLKYNCSKSLWRASGEFLASYPNLCVASLYYTVKLVKPGKLKFVYRYSNIDTFFNYMVLNEQCQNLKDTKVRWPELTEENDWKLEEIDLKSGQNIIIWRSAGVIESPSLTMAILIQKIQIEGVAYASQCDKCPAGTSSPNGSTECPSCSENYYTPLPGSPSCLACPSHKYSPKSSSQCFEREPCRVADYIETYSECDTKTKKRKLIYSWISPKICSDTLKGSIRLPSSKNQYVDCQPCNAGMYYNSTSIHDLKRADTNTSISLSLEDNIEMEGVGMCHFSPAGTYTDGLNFTTEYQKCPAGTIPRYGFYYDKWFTMPPYLNAFCYTLTGKCSSEEGWRVGGPAGYIGTYTKSHPIPGKEFPEKETTQSYKSAYFKYYMLSVDAAVKPMLPYGSVTFEFAISATDGDQRIAEGCVLYFVKTTPNKLAQIIRKWTRAQFLSELSRQNTHRSSHVTVKRKPRFYSKNSQNRLTFAYKVKSSANFQSSMFPSFRWILQKPFGVSIHPKNASGEGSELEGDYCSAYIYTINMTNVALVYSTSKEIIKGGADSCVPCITSSNPENEDIDPNLCLPCPPGHFYSLSPKPKPPVLELISSPILNASSLASANNSSIKVNEHNETGDNGKKMHCEPCPEGTVIDLDHYYGSNNNPGMLTVAACKSCGVGTKPSKNNGLLPKCVSDCKLQEKVGNGNETDRYDFRALSGLKLVDSEPLFTSGGTKYHYSFSFELCHDSESIDPLLPIVCSDDEDNEEGSGTNVNGNDPLGDHSQGDVKNGYFKNSPSVCRSIVVPYNSFEIITGKSHLIPSLNDTHKHSNNKRVLSVSLGDKLLAVGTAKVPLIARALNEEFKFKENKTSFAGKDGFSKQLSAQPDNVHFLYRSNTPTLACPNGRSTLITLICDISALSITAEKLTRQRKIDLNPFFNLEEDNISPTEHIYLPDECKLGTCDGCHFRIMLKSMHACPICSEKDFRIVKGECSNGKQVIYRYPGRYCRTIDDNSFSSALVQSCSSLNYKVYNYFYSKVSNLSDPLPSSSRTQIGVYLGSYYQIRLIVLTSMSAGVVLLSVLLFLWKKNQKLEYKYTALVQETTNIRTPRDGKFSLPAVDSCALSEGDTDEQNSGPAKDTLWRRFVQRFTERSGGSFKNVEFVGDEDGISLLDNNDNGGGDIPTSRDVRRMSNNNIRGKSFNSNSTFENITLEARVSGKDHEDSFVQFSTPNLSMSNSTLNSTRTTQNNKNNDSYLAGTGEGYEEERTSLINA